MAHVSRALRAPRAGAAARATGFRQWHLRLPEVVAEVFEGQGPVENRGEDEEAQHGYNPHYRLPLPLVAPRIPFKALRVLQQLPRLLLAFLGFLFVAIELLSAGVQKANGVEEAVGYFIQDTMKARLLHRLERVLGVHGSGLH